MYFFNRDENELPDDVPAMLTDKDGNKQVTSYWFGKTAHSWQASLDQYYSLLQQTGSVGMITVNYSYARYGTSADPVAAAAHLAADWVRYDNGRTRYWEIGNENFGDWEAGYRIDLSQNKDGQPEFLTGELYGKHFGVFADSMRQAAAGIGKTIFIGATVYESEPQNWQTNTVKTWNSSLLPALKDKQDFYVVHNYFTPYNENSTSSAVLSAAETVPAKMMSYVKAQIQQYGATVKPIAMTEWNMFATGSMQQVSNTSGLFGLIVLGESLYNHLGMAARWDLVNGWENGNDHGLFSAGDEPGIAKWSPRPSYYYLYLFRQMMGDRIVPVSVSGQSGIKAYASTYSSGEANATLVNTTEKDMVVSVQGKNFNPGARFYYYVLQGDKDNGNFSRKVLVNGQGPDGVAGGPANIAAIKPRSANTYNNIKIKVPALGAVMMVIDKK
ncbi:MAG: alpha-L-arabinofuranosidase [Flavihumibacter sp.]